MKKLIILILGFYFLTLFQISFFPHFFLTNSLNFILILVVLINLFEPRKEKLGLFSAFFGGFFLDIFSENFFGFWVLIFLAIAVFLKFILRKYVQIPIFKPT